MPLESRLLRLSLSGHQFSAPVGLPSWRGIASKQQFRGNAVTILCLQMEHLIAEDTVGSAMDEMDDALADER